jgi:hypothetical protein
LIRSRVIDGLSNDSLESLEKLLDRQDFAKRGKCGRILKPRNACVEFQQWTKVVGIYRGDQLRTFRPHHTPGLKLLGKGSCRIEGRQRYSINDPNRGDTIVRIYANDRIPTGWVDLLIPDLKVVRLLNIGVKLLPREARLGFLEGDWHRIPQSTTQMLLHHFRPCSERQAFEAESSHPVVKQLLKDVCGDP